MKLRTACMRDYGESDKSQRTIMLAPQICSCVLLIAVAFSATPALHAQAAPAAPVAPGAPAATAAAPPATAKTIAPKDFTGQWVSVVSEDWRYRMIVPKNGDYGGVPINPAGRKVADNWDPAKDEAAREQCKAYGPANGLRMPGRIRISWADNDTLKIETDAGMQTRMIYFKTPTAKGGDLQGVSEGSWETIGGTGGQGGQGFGGGLAAEAEGTPAPAAAPAPAARNARGPRYSGAIKAVTTKMRAGYLRRNGVPYSDKAVITEYFDLVDQLNGETWLVAKTIVEDPTYLSQPFITSTHFKKQNDQSGWNPTPCSVR